MKTFFCTIIFLLVYCIQADEFPFDPPKNFTLDPHLIVVHHPVTTDNVAAQLYFDQGLTLLYAFNHDASYWSFLRASQLDPELAMAYWGIALALGPNINMDMTDEREKRAYAAITQAKNLSHRISPHEYDYIQVLAKRYVPGANRQQLAQDYSAAMKKLVEKYPDDVDAAVLFAESVLDLNPWSQWTADGQPKAGTLDAVHALESVLKKDPLHLGANHYYIHAIEASFHPERALMSAERLKTLMPTSGHILHMPSHIYLLVGDYHQAALSNEQAIAVDRAYIQKYGIRGIYAMHYLSHNLYFLSRAYSMEGRFADAKRAADELANLYMPHFQHMPELEYYATAAFFTLFRFHDWQSILTVQEPPSAMQIAHALWHFARAYAYFQLQDFDQGFQEQEQFLQGIKRIPQGAKFGYNQAEKVLKIARLYLEAGLAQVRNDLNQAIEITKEAVQEQDTLHYNEPPDWYFPIRETLGGLLLRAGRYSEAEQVFRDDLDKHPRNGRSLFGLMVSLKEQGRDSYWVDEAFKKAWFYSDTTISVDKL